MWVVSIINKKNPINYLWDLICKLPPCFAEREGFSLKKQKHSQYLNIQNITNKNTFHLTKRATFTCKDNVCFNISQVSY